MRRFAPVLLLATLFVGVGSHPLATSAQGAQTPRTAQEFYQVFRDAFARATTIDDLLPYLASDVKAQIEETPVGERAAIFELAKLMGGATNVVVLKEEKTTNGVVLTATGNGPDKTTGDGRIELVRENDAWKMRRESWTWK